jgi:outer membrane beta-barrel protein
MIKRWMILVVVAAGVFAIDLPQASAQQVQISGPLAGQPAVRHMRIYREGRIRLQPFVGFTLQDEFSRTILFGGSASYHFLDWLGVGIWGGYGGVHLDTSLTDQISQRGITTDRNALSLPSRDFFPNQIGEINWVTAFQGIFVPLRGKVSLFQKVFVDTDFYIHLGVAAVGVEERASVNTEGEQDVCSNAPPPMAQPEGNACVATQTARSSRVAIAPTFGVGLNFYINDFLGLQVEWRGLPFKWNTSGTDERGAGPNGNFPDGRISGKDQIFKFNQMINVGLAIHLPTDVKISK